MSSAGKRLRLVAKTLPALRSASVVLLALVASACAQNRSFEVGLNQPFVLAERETVEFEQSGFSIAFHGVVADSRCPTDTRCVWEGNAEIRLLLTTLDDQRATTVTLHTASDAQHAKSRCAFDHTITLLGLEPERVSSGSAMLNAYSVRLNLSKGCGGDSAG